MGIIRAEIDALHDSLIIDVVREGFGKPGLIPMWAGEPDMPTPAFICDAASRSSAGARRGDR